MLDREQGRQ